MEGMTYAQPVSVPHHVGGVWTTLQGSPLVPN